MIRKNETGGYENLLIAFGQFERIDLVQILHLKKLMFIRTNLKTSWLKWSKDVFLIVPAPFKNTRGSEKLKKHCGIIEDNIFSKNIRFIIHVSFILLYILRIVTPGTVLSLFFIFKHFRCFYLSAYQDFCSKNLKMLTLSPLSYFTSDPVQNLIKEMTKREHVQIVLEWSV